MGEKSKKSRKKNSQRNFLKQGGGSKAVYKLFKKTGKMVRVGFPKDDTSPDELPSKAPIYLHEQLYCLTLQLDEISSN